MVADVRKEKGRPPVLRKGVTPVVDCCLESL